MFGPRSSTSALFIFAALAVALAVAVSASISDAKAGPELRSAKNKPALADRIPGINTRALALALTAFARAKARGEAKKNILTLIDYSLPSTQKRMWVIDLKRGELLFHELVAHGKHTGDDRARSFSNTGGSLKSSLGTFVTLDTYDGKHGYSLKLRGLEAGINDRAEERAIVMHAADYVGEDFIKRQGRLGRSWGCPAVRPEISQRLIDTIKDGSAIFAYYPDPSLLNDSIYLADR